jgi:hypothetical protein
MIRNLDSLCLQFIPELQLLRWEWRGPMSLRLFQIALGELLIFSIQQESSCWLVDLAAMPPLGLDEQEWLSELWLPCAKFLPLRHLALVLPFNLHNQLIIESVVHDGRQYFNARTQFFSDTAAALDWLTGSDALITNLEHEWQAAHSVHW